MMTDASKGKNKILGWCRRCSYTWFPSGEKVMSPADFEEWRRKQLEAEQRRKKEAEDAIALLKSQKLWEHYHDSLNDWAIETLLSWGINKNNADYWKLGLIPGYKVWGGDGAYFSPAISIPVWGYDWDVRNVKVRVLNPKNGNDRYRVLYKVHTDNAFVARPDLDAKECLCVEGETKAMVTAICKQDFQVIGLPSVTPSEKALADFDKFERIYVCLDPDATVKNEQGVSPLGRLVNLLGRERVSVIPLPDKIDDMIVKYNLNVNEIVKYAMKLEVR